MAAIFPPVSDGGVPPGPTVINGYAPAAPVIGEGPHYYSPACTTLLPALSMNAMVSEMLAFVDKAGFAWNTAIVTNMADALTTTIVNMPPAGGTPGQALVKSTPGNLPTWGAVIDAGSYT
jgi:hypothetical protein